MQSVTVTPEAPKPLGSVALQYHPVEDRILVLVNVGQADQSAWWLTRRIALALLAKVRPYLANTSIAVTRTPLAYRSEMQTMQEQVALAQTQARITRTPEQIVSNAADAADLLEEINISAKQRGFAVTLRGGANQAGGLFSREELQRVLHMVMTEANKGSWLASVSSDQGNSLTDASPNQKQKAN